MYVHRTLERLLPLCTDLRISDVHTSVGCELHVLLMSWLTSYCICTADSYLSLPHANTHNTHTHTVLTYT